MPASQSSYPPTYRSTKPSPLRSAQQAPRETDHASSGMVIGAKATPALLRYACSEDHENRSRKPSLSKSAATTAPTSLASRVKLCPALFFQTTPPAQRSVHPSLLISAQQAGAFCSSRLSSAVRSVKTAPGCDSETDTPSARGSAHHISTNRPAALTPEGFALLLMVDPLVCWRLPPIPSLPAQGACRRLAGLQATPCPASTVRRLQNSSPASVSAGGLMACSNMAARETSGLTAL